MTRLHAEQLDNRDCPAVGVTLPSGLTILPYPDWSEATYNTLQSGDVTVIGAGVGGGPRVSWWLPDGTRQQPDQFFGDPGDRSGIKPFAVPAPPAPVEPPVTVGTGAFSLFLDGASGDMVQAVASYLTADGDVVSVTNQRPNLAPGKYATINFDSPVGWTHAPDAAGVADAGSIRRDDGTPAEGYVTYSGVKADRYAVVAALHEFGHMAGLDHSSPPSVMSGTLYFGADAAFTAAELDVIRKSVQWNLAH